MLTLRPSQTTPADKTYSLTNTHGDNFATTDASGVQQTTTITGPFGEPLPGQTNPNNTANGSVFGWAGQYEKVTESLFSMLPVSMGVRTYIPVLGRFAQVDPVEGGTLNAYVYAHDPVNGSDYSGLCAYVIQCTATTSYLQPAQSASQMQPARSGSSIQKANTRPLQAKAPRAVAQKPAPLPLVQLKAISMSAIPNTTSVRGFGTKSLGAPSGGGYFNVGVSVAFRVWHIPIGINAGVKIGGRGVHPYVGGSLAFRTGLGGSLTYSPSSPSTGWSAEACGFYWVGGCYGLDGSWEAGIGTPGVSAGGTYTW